MMLLVYTVAGVPSNLYDLSGLKGVANNAGATQLTVGADMIDIKVTVAQFYEAIRTYQLQKNKKLIFEIRETS